MLDIIELTKFGLTSSSIQIIDIRSAKARNYLRGINDLDSHRQISAALRKIKDSCSKHDYISSLKVLRSHSYFENNIVGRNFPTKCLKPVPEVVHLFNRDLTQEFEQYSSELEDLCLKANYIVTAIADDNLLLAVNECRKFADKGGVSLFLIRMLVFIQNRYHSLELTDPELLEKSELILSSICISNIDFLQSAIRELSNLRTDYFSIRKKLERLDDSHPHHCIAKSYISQIPRSSSEFKNVLCSFYSFSLFDAYLYYERMLLVDLPFGDPLVPVKSNSLRVAYKKLTKAHFEPSDMYSELDGSAPHSYLRESFLISEQLKAFQYKTIHDIFYTDSEVKCNQLPYERKLLKTYFEHVDSLSDLRSDGISNVLINFNVYDKISCGFLENSSALLYILDKYDGQLSKDDEARFVELMSSTRDIGETCRKEYLERLSVAATLPSLRLVVCCLISIQNKSSIADYELRSAIQEICQSEFSGDLNKLVQYLYDISPAVCEHLILTCDETFLSKLFHIMEKPVEAIKARADMLNWFGDITGDDTYIDRAKNLRIDIQISKEKGTIDDSRIYVDPLKYTQWINDNIQNELTLLLEGLSTFGATFVLNWDESSTGIKTVDSIMSLLLRCYEEFCSNNIFGIASYLGRRIRHGTFKGTGLTEVKSLESKEEYSYLFEDPDFKKYYDTWILNYRSMIDDLVHSFLHIRTKKKPQGYITTKMDSTIKKRQADRMFVDIVNSFDKHQSAHEIPYIVSEYCWRFVEADLISIRKLLMENKSTFGVFNYKPKTYANSQFKRREVHRFTQDINNITAEKFRTISSWFNKPSYASPSTDLNVLFRAVVSEVKESIDQFNPEISLPETPFNIAGGMYFVIYDALYVLIYNAAKHGKEGGKLSFSVEMPEQGESINLSVSSEVATIVDFDFAVQNIEKYMALFSEDANLFEGKSGIKKLKRLEREGSITHLNFTGARDKLQLAFSFNFILNTRSK